MDKKKLKDKWCDLIMKQYYLQKDIDAEENIQQKSLLEMDLKKISKSLARVEEKLFQPESPKTPCTKCKYGLYNINREPCKSCIEGESHFEEIH